MNLLDLGLVVLAGFAMAGGWRLGLLARVASWVGAIGGMLLAVWALPAILRGLGPSLSPSGGLFVILSVVLLATGLGSALGELVGHELRRFVAPGPLGAVDRSLGAVAGLAGVAAGVWLLLPALANVPGNVARYTRGSKIVAAVQSLAPQPPDTVQALRALVGDTRFPEVFDNLRPAPDTGPPPADIPVPAAVVERARASTVNVESEGCGGTHEGSGFTVAADTVVTNAHVVAGGTRIRVRRPDQRLFTARIVVYEPGRDLAILQATGLGEDPLPVASATAGAVGVDIGYPGGQNVPRLAPVAVKSIQPTDGRDIYDRSRITRRVLFLAANLHPGDSGSPLVDPAGRVIGVAFAIAPDNPDVAFALDTSELRAVLALPRQVGAGGPCV